VRIIFKVIACREVFMIYFTYKFNKGFIMKKIIMLVIVGMFMSIGCITKVVQVEDVSAGKPFKVYYNTTPLPNGSDITRTYYLYTVDPDKTLDPAVYSGLIEVYNDYYLRGIVPKTSLSDTLLSLYPKPLDSVKYNKSADLNLPDGTIVYYVYNTRAYKVYDFFVYHDQYVDLYVRTAIR
jgi:hypothetical protein